MCSFTLCVRRKRLILLLSLRPFGICQRAFLLETGVADVMLYNVLGIDEFLLLPDLVGGQLLSYPQSTTKT